MAKAPPFTKGKGKKAAPAGTGKKKSLPPWLKKKS